MHIAFVHPEKFGMVIHHRNFKYYHEDLPPVFTSPFAEPDEVYRVFLDGVRQLAQAMAKRPDFGSGHIPDNPEQYGTFWSIPHV